MSRSGFGRIHSFHCPVPCQVVNNIKATEAFDNTRQGPPATGIRVPSWNVGRPLRKSVRECVICRRRWIFPRHASRLNLGILGLDLSDLAERHALY